MRAPSVFLAVALVGPTLAGCATAPDPASGEVRGDASLGNSAPAGSQPSKAPTGEEWPPNEEADLRPGVRVRENCTTNLLFSSPEDDSLYLSTAGHCMVGFAVQNKSVGDPVSIADGRYEGTLAFAVVNGSFGSPEYTDFALIEIPRSAHDEVHPAILGVGGPTGLAESASPGDRLVIYGNASSREDGQLDRLDPRTGVVTERRGNQTEFVPFSSIDSGSPVLTADGRALGVFWGFTMDSPGIVPCAGCGMAADVDAGMAAAAETGLEVQLETWPEFEGLAPGTVPASSSHVASGSMDRPDLSG